MGQLGDLLRETREAKGLSLEQVEQTTKIRYKLLEALEQENFEDLPAPVFVKGFLRNYALLLGLDADEVLGLYKEATGDIEIPYELHALDEPLEPAPSRVPMFVGGLVLVVLLSVAGWIATQQGWVRVPRLRAAWLATDTPTVTVTLTSLPTATHTEMPVIQLPTASRTLTRTNTPTLTKRATSSPTRSPTGTYSPEPTGTETETGTTTRTPSRTATARATRTPTISRTATSRPTVTPTFVITAPIHVRLEFVKDVWVRVYSDGAKIFDEEGEEGGYRDWTAQEQLYIHSAYGNAARAIVNGAVYGLLGDTADPIRIEWTLASGTPSVVSPVAPTQVVLPSATPATSAR